MKLSLTFLYELDLPKYFYVLLLVLKIMFIKLIHIAACRYGLSTVLHTLPLDCIYHNLCIIIMLMFPVGGCEYSCVCIVVLVVQGVGSLGLYL